MHTLQNTSIATFMNTVVKGIRRSVGAKGTTWFYFRGWWLMSHLFSMTPSCLHNSWNQNKSFGFQTDSSEKGAEVQLWFSTHSLKNWDSALTSWNIQYTVAFGGTDVLSRPSEQHFTFCAKTQTKTQNNTRVSSSPTAKIRRRHKIQNSSSYIDFKGWAQHPL